LLLYGGVMVLVMLFMPKGIIGVAENIRARLTRPQPAAMEARVEEAT
jgi:hypothetical protein